MNMKCIVLGLFMSIANLSTASACIPPADSVENIDMWNMDNSDVVFRGELIDIKNKKLRDKKTGWNIFSIAYEFQVSETIKSENEMPNNVTINKDIACENCSFDKLSSDYKYTVGGKYLVYANWVGGVLEFNRCAKTIKKPRLKNEVHHVTG